MFRYSEITKMQNAPNRSIILKNNNKICKRIIFILFFKFWGILAKMYFIYFWVVVEWWFLFIQHGYCLNWARILIHLLAIHLLAYKTGQPIWNIRVSRFFLGPLLNQNKAPPSLGFMEIPAWGNMVWPPASTSLR